MGSCTRPRNALPWFREVPAQRRHPSPMIQVVECICSGANTRRSSRRYSGSPAARSAAAKSTTNPTSEYSTRSPGAPVSGRRSTRCSASSGVAAEMVAPAGSPAVCVSRSRMVTRSFPAPVNSGRYACTGSSSDIRPSSTRSITAVVVPTTLVSEARS